MLFSGSFKSTDYLVRELLSLTKGGIIPSVLSPMRAAIQRNEMSMALVISVLCFVSRMRMRDQGPVNGIPISRRMFIILKRFFTRAALRGLVSNRRHPRAHSL